MSKPTSTVKDRWNAKAYDTIVLRVPKGKKEELKQDAAQRGYSLNGYILKAIAKMKENGN